MGFISNQWLNRGQGLRRRRYAPVSVRVVCDQPGDAWSLTNEVKLEFTARRSNGEFQSLHLTQTEIDAAVDVVMDAASAEARERMLKRLRLSAAEADAIGEAIVAAMSAKARERVLVRFLKVLTHARFLRVLAFDLRARVKLPKKP